MPLRGKSLCLLSLIAIPATGSCLLAAEDDWPRYGRDGALTARSPLKGDIGSPRESWRFSVAGRELVIEALPAEGRHPLDLSEGASPDSGAPRRVPQPGPPARDIDGSGVLRPAAETFHERWAKILPGVKGLQRVAWSHTWTDQKVCRLQLFAYDQGYDKPRMVWQSEPDQRLGVLRSSRHCRNWIMIWITCVPPWDGRCNLPLELKLKKRCN